MQKGQSINLVFEKIDSYGAVSTNTMRAAKHASMQKGCTHDTTQQTR